MTVVDRETQRDLCTYELEEQPEDVRKQYTSVTMCRVYRSAQCAPHMQTSARHAPPV